MLHVCGKVNRHDVRIWGTENPHATVEHVRDSPKENAFLPFPLAKFTDRFSFEEPNVTGMNYLDMLQLWQMPQFQEDSEKAELRHSSILTSVRN
jgi:hypothetical protein